MEPRRTLPTHEVLNQPADPGGADLWAADRPLRDHAAAAGARPDALAAAGARLGAAEMREAGEDARRIPPVLAALDRSGARLDEVRFHPAYHRLLAEAQALGYVSAAWDGAPGAHATHAALVYLLTQVEPGTCCPLTMSYAAVPALSADPAIAAEWVPKLTAGAHDPALAPPARKSALTMGMAMTEVQGGSDVRANRARAEPDGDGYRLTGHKWFCSAPMSDGFLTLAQAPGGLTCFVLPRWLDGGRNAIRIDRLKDKLGNRANASAEIVLEGAHARRLGPEGDGVRTIIEMVHHTRLDTAMAPAGLMRAALAEALRWAGGRTVFQRRLIDQPLMRAVLADLALDLEAALALGLRVARAFDAGERDFARPAVAAAKFHANKRAPWVIAEAMEALGGMGYVEDTPLPMLYREAPLNGIWEGSGNVIALDFLRTLARSPAAAEALRAEAEGARGLHPAFDAALDDWPAGPVPEAEARREIERAALLLGAAALAAGAPSAIAEAYCETRLARRSLSPGTVRLDADAILDRLAPA
ncbi:MAG: acyl-CoA dehydrogenase family protein [Hasllibacter sp.]